MTQAPPKSSDTRTITGLHAGRTTSVWHASPSPGAPLRADVDTDVVVVGGGITGLTTAWLLAKKGARVVVVDDGPIGSGETERTTAHLASALDERFVHLEKLHGKDNARLAAQSHAQAIDQIEAIVRELQIDCDFQRVDGYLFAADDDDSDGSDLDDECAAAVRAGLVAEVVDAIPSLPRLGRAVRFSNQAEFEPMRYLHAMALACEARGVVLCTNTHADRIEGGDAPKVVTDDGFTISAAKAVVVATNTPVNDILALHTKQLPYRSYVIGLRVAAGALPHALWWDTGDPYHYVRVMRGVGDNAGHDVLIVGGEDHKTGQVDDATERFDLLEAWARERFVVGARVSEWSGQVMEPIDGLAFIGKNPLDHDNVYVATGDSGHGLTHGTIAGMMLSEMIFGVDDHPWAALYDPRRKSLQGITDYAKESFNVAVQYARWLKGSDVAHDEDIPRGSGAVQRRGLSLVAVSVGDDGCRHECSAVCPHLGAIVAWNDLEKSWDCPLHGSRFTPTGAVMNGPTNKGLERLGDVAPSLPDLGDEEATRPIPMWADRK